MTGTVPAQPPRQPPSPGLNSRTHTFAGTEESPGLARRALRRDLHGHVADMDDALLLVSEAVTNAVQHSRSKLGGTVGVTVMVMCDRVRVEVNDAGPLSGNRPVVLQGGLGETGRGLRIISEYASAWGWELRQWGGVQGGTSVWFELPRGAV